MSARPTAAKPKPKSAAPIRLKARSKETPREALFVIDKDGEETEYTAPVTVTFGHSLTLRAFLDQVDERTGERFLVQELCGPQALAAALGSEMTDEQWKEMTDRLRKKALGPTEREDGEEGN